MRIILCLFFIVAMTSCTANKKWDKDTLVNDCLTDFTKKNQQDSIFTTMQLANVCDCLVEKMLVKYKSYKESDNDPNGMQQLGRDCATQVMQSKQWNGSLE